MEEDIVRLFYKGSEIILIGTSHISAESADLVRKTIQEENPDTICIEWDEKRYKKTYTQMGSVAKSQKGH
ncbi:TraB/GumN family protein [Enterococcus faecalis]|uniref:TraB/GumN family protein n=3 Tax=Enterococcus TaxID=1350 RepID=A0AAX3AV73_ENTFL|nr:TraB/GumN family protein [Enterococcus faecalis]MCT9928071.1 TraB/GumN family protein [Enterococcus faecalis]MCV5984494.1 TraB/GumN family protein [Enterococcus faecalis]MCV5994579.1 TraB/GumN family protein [Enterococcus faecalis]MCV5997628.1 TraB/GumN family protein [Enterococcus faecalis]MCV6008974.1 TraB/GumN family protein [Enterococcus faecalis]